MRYPKFLGTRVKEYDRVYIDPNVAASVPRPNGPSTNEFGDEANIAYLAYGASIPTLKGSFRGQKAAISPIRASFFMTYQTFSICCLGPTS
jgi:hypothetical protein